MALNFRRQRPEEPEINLIPFIDVLLVILIFLMLSTTYSKFTELQISLPVADADQARDRPKEIIVAVSADGRYSGQQEAGRRPQRRRRSTAELGAAAAGSPDMVLIISADATAAHQSVINVMDAARRVGLAQAHLRDAVVGRRRALTRPCRRRPNLRDADRRDAAARLAATAGRSARRFVPAAWHSAPRRLRAGACTGTAGARTASCPCPSSSSATCWSAAQARRRP